MPSAWISPAGSSLYHALDKALKRLHQKKAELLRVLERPDIPLHNNAAEEGMRDVVKKRKVSAGTYSESGRMCRDHFASLKKTCLKLKVPILEYLRDRIFKRNAIPPLPDLIRAKAVASGAQLRTGLLRAYGKRSFADHLIDHHRTDENDQF